MLVVPEKQEDVKNLLLKSLPASVYEKLKKYLIPVKLELGEVLCYPGQPLQKVWFITKGVASLISTTSNGNSIEVGMVGNEGVIGLPVLLKGEGLPYRVDVQMAGEALCLPLDILREEFNRYSALHLLLMRYTSSVLLQFAQSSVCNHFHTIEERLCRWLLILHDHAQNETICITQELIAEMLGVRRAGVTLVAGTLQRAGLIQNKRGRITVINRKKIEGCSCECYWIVRNEFKSLFAM